MENEIISWDEAISLINEASKSDEKWKAFNEFVVRQVNKAERISKKSVTKGLILEAMELEVENYKEETVNDVVKGLDEEKQRYVNKRYNSIRSLVSQAYNEAPKRKSTEKMKKSKMTVDLPNGTKVDLNTYAGFKSLMEYRLDKLNLSELSEIETIVKEKIKNSGEGNQLHKLRETAHEKERSHATY